MQKANPDYTFECSWEVCNKVGGIYTVITSKIQRMQESFDNLFFIGPYLQNSAKVETKQLLPDNNLKHLFEELKKEGIMVYYGEWRITGAPKVFLLDFSNITYKNNELKASLWNDYQIDSINSGWDFDEQVIFSYAISRFLKKFEELYDGKKITAHLHEWQTGVAALFLKQMKSQIGTVFTTHATMLGRSISSTGQDLYLDLDSINPMEKARELGVMDKHSTEVACAKHADCYTTVSEITCIEAEKLIGIKPEILTLNGLDFDKYPTFEETSIQHRKNRDNIRKFLSYYFYPYYHLDLKKNLIFFTAARYEYKNKGMDIFIKALGKLNKKLKDENSEKTITAMFFVPNQLFGIKPELLQAKEAYQHMEKRIKEDTDEIKDLMIQDIFKSDKISENVFSDDFLHDLQKIKYMMKKQGNPPRCTHHIYSEDSDAIISEFNNSGLFNEESDKVKVILYPVYLNGSDSLINLTYEQVITGGHLGVYCSYYEPWGYTPLETAAFGVPTVTSDRGGFGRFINPLLNGDGISVLKRYEANDNQSVDELMNIMDDFLKLNQSERVEAKMNAKELTKNCDWKDFIKNYIDAHNIALSKHN